MKTPTASFGRRWHYKSVKRTVKVAPPQKRNFDVWAKQTVVSVSKKAQSMCMYGNLVALFYLLVLYWRNKTIYLWLACWSMERKINTLTNTSETKCFVEKKNWWFLELDEWNNSTRLVFVIQYLSKLLLTLLFY